MIEKNPYTILRLKSTDNQESIKQSFKKLAKENHPDNGGNEEYFKDVNRAYQILSDPKEKEKYDKGFIDFYGNKKIGASHSADYAKKAYGKHKGGGHTQGSKKWRDIFGEHQKALNGADVSVTVYLDIKIAKEGCNRIVSLPNGKKINVKVPPHAKDGQQLRVKGMGSAGKFGGEPGDAIIHIYVTGLPKEYISENDNYVYILKVTIDEAILGTKIEVPSPTGSPLMITIPPMTNNGNRLRLKGLGKTSKDSLFVEIKVVYDKNDKDLIKYMEKYSKKRKFNPREL